MDFKNYVITLKDLSFGYTPDHTVLKHINIAIEKGERAALLGSNGSGKTTLFHLIMGLHTPHEGTIRIFGKERADKKDFFDVRRRIGLLFQDSDDQLFSPTVAEDIAFGPFNLGKSRGEVRGIVTETLELLGLEGFEQRFTYKLSGGEKRLVALGTILAMNPEVLLLDEPVIGLDEEHRNRFIGILRARSITYLIISHDHDFLNQVTRTSYVLRNGSIE
jgi:cobalt/nickel transport system ATP-binding protein